jgi:hypothetical protein
VTNDELNRIFLKAQQDFGPLVFTLCDAAGRPWRQAWATSSEVAWNSTMHSGEAAAVFHCQSRYLLKDFACSFLRVYSPRTGKAGKVEFIRAKTLRSGGDGYVLVAPPVALLLPQFGRGGKDRE